MKNRNLKFRPSVAALHIMVSYKQVKYLLGTAVTFCVKMPRAYIFLIEIVGIGIEEVSFYL